MTEADKRALAVPVSLLGAAALLVGLAVLEQTQPEQVSLVIAAGAVFGWEWWVLEQRSRALSGTAIAAGLVLGVFAVLSGLGPGSAKVVLLVGAGAAVLVLALGVAALRGASGRMRLVAAGLWVVALVAALFAPFAVSALAPASNGISSSLSELSPVLAAAAVVGAILVRLLGGRDAAPPSGGGDE